MRASKRSVAGMPAHQARVAELRDELEWQRQRAVLIALMPYAARRLPDNVLRCFDDQQRQVKPLPKQFEARRRLIERLEGLIPQQRKPLPAEVLERNNRGGRA